MTVMAPGLARFDEALKRLGRRGRRRVLSPSSGTDFTSNDYLGLATSGALNAGVLAAIERGVPTGAGGSRLLRGNHPEHDALEREAALFFGAERMLYFNSGYSANLALFSTLPQRGDLVVHDALIHASVRAGLAAGKAEAISVPHNDVDAVEATIKAWRQRKGRGYPWIAVESLYSMDGDRAPLAALCDIADRYEGFLVIDEAHATGVHGDGGRGLAAALEGRHNVVVVHTCGKALGASGALIGCHRTLCDYLVNQAGPFIYSTAASPLQAASVRAALLILAHEPQRRVRLHALIALANTRLWERLGIAGSGSQILPVILGEIERTQRVANRLKREGFDIRAIRPPTVPAGTARLRLSITLNVDEGQVEQMIDRLVIALEAERP